MVVKKLSLQLDSHEFPAYYVTAQAEVSKALSKLSEHNGTFGLDIETSKLEKYKEHKQAGLCPYLSQIRLIQIYDTKRVFIFDLNQVSLKSLKPFLKDKKFISHNGAFEIKFLTHNGVPDLDIGCSMIMSKLVMTAEQSVYDPSSEEEAALEEEPDGTAKYKRKGHTLEDVSGRMLDLRLSKELQKSDWGAPELSREQLAYAAADAYVTYHVGKLLNKKIKTYKMERHYRLEKASQHVVAAMELRGFPVDWELHQKFVDRWEEAQGKASRQCYGYFKDINLNSSQQLESWAKKYFKNSPVLTAWNTQENKTPKGKLSFNSNVLKKFSKHEPIKYLLEYKEYSKLLSTYGETFAAKKHPVTGHIHCGFTLSETRTGRLSSRNPNLQQWPKGESRAIFRAMKPNEVMVVADFSQIELRVQAALSNDPVMNKVFKNNGDLYAAMGQGYYGKKITKADNPQERDFMKGVILSLSYGMGAPKLSNKLTIELDRNISLEEAIRAKSYYYKLFRVYIEWCNSVRTRAKDLGYVRTVLGKVRRLNSNEIFTKGPNTEVQGSAAELIKVAMLKMHKAGIALCNSIHDEGVCVCDKKDQADTIATVNDCMNGAMEYMFPKAVNFNVAEAHAGNSWYEAKM